MDFSFSEDEEAEEELVPAEASEVLEAAEVFSESLGLVVEVKSPGTPEEKDASRSPPGPPSPRDRPGEPVQA